MQPLHERLLAAMREEREQLTSRRAVLANAGKIAGGATVALTLGGVPGLRGVAAQEAFEDDVAVLNYALTLEHLEYAFYRDGLEQFDEGAFGESPFNRPIRSFLEDIRDHERDHVETLTQVINDLGGEPVEEAEYDFGYSDVTSFLATAQALENTGVSAYDGAGQFLSDPGLLTAAGTIVAVEARHASYLNLLNGTLPFPAAFETPLSRDEVLEIAGPFIVNQDGADESTPEA